MTVAGGSNLQVQWNNAGTLDGMAGSSWNASNQVLTLTGSGTDNTTILTLTKAGNESSILDLNMPTGTQNGKVLRVFEPGDQTNVTPVTYIGNGGEIKTRAWLTVSGNVSGTGDGYVINDPLNSGTYPLMLAVWADVPYAITARTYNGTASGDETGGYIFVGVDWNGYQRLMIPSDGALCWGPGGSTFAQGGNAPALDTRLGRAAAGTLFLGDGTYGDYSGTLKLSNLTFADGTTQTTAATSSGVSGVTIAPGKSITVNSIITLGGSDSKTLTVNNSLGLSGTDGTTMTFPAASDTVAGLDTVQTFTAINTFNAQTTFNNDVVIANNQTIFGETSTGAAVTLFKIDSGNNFGMGSAALTGQMFFYPGTGKQIRFLNAATTAYMMAMLESSRSICFGANVFDSIWTFYDNTPSTGDSVLSIRAGAAREARVRFGSNSGTYDVGLQRDSAGGVLNVTDASTTATNFRGLRVRDLMVNGSSSLGGGAGVIALANATTPPTSTPTGGGILYVQNGALMYLGSSGTVTTIANA